MTGHSFTGLGPAATLAATLDAWRADRSRVALANRVDEASSRVPRLAPPRKLQGWWLELARTYEPVTAATLLDNLHVQARGDVADRVRPRVAAMLAWPDDPRVALALAHALHEPPFVERWRARPTALESSAEVEAIVRRILAIGDLRATGKLAPLVDRQFRRGLDALVAAALVDAAPPTAREDDPDAAWQAVIDAPFDLDARLVLADAYLERGDPRGELIALQCAPHVAIASARAAGQTLDATGMFGIGAERIQALLSEHWYRWFGEVGLVVSQQLSRLRAGLLSKICIGRAAAPAWAWQQIPHDRELCAVEEVVPSSTLDPAMYVEFLGALPRMPRWVQLRDHSLAALARHPLPLTGVRYMVGARDPADVIPELLAHAPPLTHLAFDYLRPQHMDALDVLVAQYPQLVITVRRDGW